MTPDEALRAEVEAAAERWSAATGCQIEAAPGGARVELVASIARPDGSQAPGWTSDERDRVLINAQCGAPQRAEATLHELGHLLGGDHTASDGVLSGQKGRRSVIDAEALVSVCSRLPCPAMSPEGP